MRGWLVFICILTLGTTLAAQKSYRLNDASKSVDVGIEVGSCATNYCNPPAKYLLFRKGASRPFQTISVSQINIWDDPPKANSTRRYDEQSVINLADFNFDGLQDIAVNDGQKGGYGMPSYQVYLYSARLKRFVYSAPFTRLNNNGLNLGFMEIDFKKKMLYRFSKSGCCWHQTEGFHVVNGRPKKVYEFTEENNHTDAPETVFIYTRKLINGKWREWQKRAKASEYYVQ